MGNKTDLLKLRDTAPEHPQAPLPTLTGPLTHGLIAVRVLLQVVQFCEACQIGLLLAPASGLSFCV